MPPANINHTPPSSTSSNGASPDGHQFRVVRKRNRVPLSCAACRHRKLKCDRGHPCDNCTKRGDTQACSYAAPGNKRRSGAHGANTSPDDMQNRIDRLEGLVLSLMTSGGSQPGSTAAAQAAVHSSRSESLSTGSDLRLDVEGNDMIREESTLLDGDGEADSDVDQVSHGIGIMKMDGQRAVYASDAHWYAILGEISEVKNYFNNHKKDYLEHMEKVQAAKADESPGTAYLLQGAPAIDKSELLANFPNKADADRLIARYFNAYDPSVHIIHGPSFQTQYDRHWQSPQETSVVWIGMCFAMMTLALQSYHRAGDEPPEYRGRALHLSHSFRRLTAQALLLADITQPIAQMLETLVLHLQAEYGRSRDAEPGVLLMVSLCVRLAMRMGYHRDPEPHKMISPFQGEMRRRLWTFVRQCDLLISFQFGLPAMIRTDHIDTQTPRNLYDDELQEDLQALPPSRQNFEATPMSYMIAKSKMTFLFGKIVERTQSISDPPQYEEVMRYDQELRELRATHPPLLQMRSFQESARDPANLIMQRLGLEMVYLRSLFVVHRRFIARGRENLRFAYSRRTCIDASMQLLAHQATLHSESQPGGRLRSVKWHISSLTTHDFLLAAMLVCLDLYHIAEAERRGRKTGSTTSHSSPTNPLTTELYAEDRREEMLRAVEHCITIWESLRDASMEAYKASLSLRVMVEKLKAHQAEHASGGIGLSTAQQNGIPNFQALLQGREQWPIGGRRNINFGIFPNGNVGDFNTDHLPPEQSAAMTLGMLSSGGLSPNPSFGAGALAGMSTPSLETASSYPAKLAGLLNEPTTAGAEFRTGLTPPYTGREVGLTPSGAASPFSQMLAGGGMGNEGLMGMEGLGGDIDWGAWDSYIQGTTNTAMSPAPVWPMNLDIAGLDATGVQNQTQQGGYAGQQANPGGVFMGASTPGQSGAGIM